MSKLRTEFFDSRDKYLSFVHTTDEKVRIAFYLASQLRNVRTAPGQPFYLLDAGTGEGTVLATFLTALHKRLPEEPIIVTGKEISIDDICILLSYLPDRFAEHKSLVVHLTNLTYEELADLPAAKFTHVKKAISGGTSHEFGLQLMNMATFVKKHWALDVRGGKLLPQQKIMLTLYRKDRQRALQKFLLPVGQPPPFNFIIAAQPFRLRRPPAQVAAFVIAPLLRLLAAGGRMVLVYSSGRDFSKPLLRLLYPDVRPYANAAPAKLLAAVKKLPLTGICSRVEALRYGFINLYLGRHEFSLGNILSLWKAVTYIGQISDAEAKAAPLNSGTERKIREQMAKARSLSFVNNVIIFTKARRRQKKPIGAAPDG